MATIIGEKPLQTEVDAYFELVEQYMHGDCAYLAAAMHHLYKLPLGMLIVFHRSKHNVETAHLSHAWAVAAEGYVDIQGLQTLDQVSYFKVDASKWEILCPVSLAELEEFLAQKLPADNPDVIKATIVLEKYKHWIFR